MRLVLGSLHVLAYLVCGPAIAVEAQPYEIIRELQDMQDGLSSGVPMSDAASEKAVSRFTATANLPSVNWGDRRNRSSLIFYLLTGGFAGDVKPALANIPESAGDRKLLAAAFAYAETHQKSHRPDDAVVGIPIDDAPPEIAPVLALTQAQFLQDTDKSKSLEKLRLAQILAPGGFIEDMSLRMELQLFDAASDTSRLQSIATRYLSRFASSAFAAMFEQRLDQLLGESWRVKDESRRGAFAELIEAMPEGLRVQLGLSLVRSALMQGEVDGLKRVIGAACFGTRDDEIASGARCKLYGHLLTAETINGFGREGEDPGAQLSVEDRMMYACALALADLGEGDSGAARDGIDVMSGANAKPEVPRAALERVERADKFLAEAANAR